MSNDTYPAGSGTDANGSELRSADRWYEGDEGDSTVDEYPIKEYDITASPNDFNTLTLFSFIESGSVSIPGFQRNYVWDIKRASKLIESMIIGLPIPQIFLYEESRNRFLVIDGQQRLMSMYYFVKQRFPKKERRVELRSIFERNGKIPDNVFEDDDYFTKFNLQLPEQLPSRPNRFNRLNYSTLGDYKTTFDLRTIRNIIIKQNLPANDDSSIYEIFNRLNSGGVNLTSQEIRASLYHSEFYDMLHRLNAQLPWRSLIGVPEPDLHMKDLEILLRAFAMLVDGDDYTPSMTSFLNHFSRKGKSFESQKIAYMEQLFGSFLNATRHLVGRPFHGERTNKFNISAFEAVFYAICRPAFAASQATVPEIDALRLRTLKADPEFVKATLEKTTSRANVRMRLDRALALLAE